MIHADGAVALRAEFLEGAAVQAELHLGRGQLLLGELTLVTLEPRHVRVAVERDAVRPQSRHETEGLGKTLGGLERQPIDQVEVGGLEAEPPRVLEKLLRHLVRLVATDRLLDVGVEVLHAHREPIEAEVAQRLEVLDGGHPRVDFDRHLRIVLELEVSPDVGVDAPHLLRRVVGGGAAAPVILGDGAIALQATAHLRDLLLEMHEVAGRDAALLRDHDVAAAEEAALLAERQVDVETDRSAALRGSPQMHRVLGGADAIVELDGGGVRRVPGPRLVVALQEVVERFHPR